MESYQNQTGSKKGHIDQSSVQEGEADKVTNEYVLNVAFWTFFMFVFFEGVFAVIAGSQSMLEDAEAMLVDALTYLFNLWAERIKNRPYTQEELGMSFAARDYRRDLLELYLELVPPLLSMITLVAVTLFAIRDAFGSLTAPEGEEEADVSVNLMLIFSLMNLLLDIVNVTCFARAHQAFGLGEIRRESKDSIRHARESGRSIPPVGEPGCALVEMDALMEKEDSKGGDMAFSVIVDDSEMEGASESDMFVNLNMCSAWTVSRPVSETLSLHNPLFLTFTVSVFFISACLCRHVAINGCAGRGKHCLFLPGLGIRSCRRLTSCHCCVSHHFSQSCASSSWPYCYRPKDNRVID
jgi:Co/Zn/Cd efflux system component